MQNDVRQFVPDPSMLPLRPDSKRDAGTNNLSLIFNAMTEAYTTTALNSKPNMHVSGQAFAQFLKTM